MPRTFICRIQAAVLTASAILCWCSNVTLAEDYFQIRVVDDVTGGGIPMVELKMVNEVTYVTDSLGNVAIHEPELVGKEVWFSIQSHGYIFPKDGFGYRGARVKIEPGGSAELKMRRTNLAKRLYRITGSGIYRDSRLLGLGDKIPDHQSELNAKVFGSDSVVSTLYQGKLYTFWGDTNRPGYPLGNFHVPGATIEMPKESGLDPLAGLKIDYFVKEDGFVKETCRMPGDGPTWIDGVCSFVEEGKEVLLAKYVKVKQPLEVYEQGLVKFDDQAKKFEKLVEFEMSDSAILLGHTFVRKEGEKQYVYCCKPFPLLRVEAKVDSIVDPKAYESYSYFRSGSRNDRFEIEKDDGVPVLAWRANSIPLDQKFEDRLVKEGKIREADRFFNTRDVESGDRVALPTGSCYWNEYRKKWIVIATQVGGKSSLLGEVWYVESSELTGPWDRAVKILTHENYSFYNPKHHPYFDRDGGKTILFEGTYTTLFTNNSNKTPRYEYNQMMYRLDLEDLPLKD